MEKRLGRLEVLWTVPDRVIEETSWDIEAFCRWPDGDPEERAAHIRQDRGLTDIALERAIETMFLRWGTPCGEARMIAALGLEQLLAIAAHETEAA
jgi:hypothetical protein